MIVGSKGDSDVESSDSQIENENEECFIGKIEIVKLFVVLFNWNSHF